MILAGVVETHNTFLPSPKRGLVGKGFRRRSHLSRWSSQATLQSALPAQIARETERASHGHQTAGREEAEEGQLHADAARRAIGQQEHDQVVALVDDVPFVLRRAAAHRGFERAARRSGLGRHGLCAQARPGLLPGHAGKLIPCPSSRNRGCPNRLSESLTRQSARAWRFSATGPTRTRLRGASR